jgi:hypothetical protein
MCDRTHLQYEHDDDRMTPEEHLQVMLELEAEGLIVKKRDRNGNVVTRPPNSTDPHDIVWVSALIAGETIQ